MRESPEKESPLVKARNRSETSSSLSASAPVDEDECALFEKDPALILSEGDNGGGESDLSRWLRAPEFAKPLPGGEEERFEDEKEPDNPGGGDGDKGSGGSPNGGEFGDRKGEVSEVGEVGEVEVEVEADEL